MKSVLVLTIVLALAGPAMAADCQTFVAKDGTLISFANHQSAVIRTGNQVETCEASFGGAGEEIDQYSLRCGADLSGYIKAEEATFDGNEFAKTLEFRGETFSRSCV